MANEEMLKEEIWIQDEVKLKRCPDGSVIVIAERIDNKWQELNVRCLE